MLITLLLAPLGALAATTTILDFDFGQIALATSPTFTGPPIGAVSQTIPYDSAAVSSTGSAAVTGEEVPLSGVPSLATASIPVSLIIAQSDTPVSSSTTATVPTSTVPTSTIPDASTVPTSTTPDVSIVSTPTAPDASSASTSTVPDVTTASTSTVPDVATASTSTVPDIVAKRAAPLTLAKRGDCSKQPDGWGPLPSKDDVWSFMNNPVYRISSLKAVTPRGYQKTFSNQNASVSANSYLGLQTMRTYDPLGCSQWCDNTTLCTGFNIFHERDPSLDPGLDCLNPPTIVNYKCTLWGSGVELAAANNFGQWRMSYQVVISGSNGYEKTNTTQPITPKGCLKPQRCNGGALRAVNALLDTKFFPGAFDINVCAAYANAQNVYNKKVSKNWFLATNKCKLVNAYMIKRDGVAMGTYCGLYAQYFATSAATYQPGRLGNRFWGIESSFNVIVISGWI